MNNYKLFKAIIECMKYNLILDMEKINQNMTDLQKAIKTIEEASNV